jgi:nickel transport protein
MFNVLLCLASTTAVAHGLNLFVHEEAGGVKGSAYFTGGVPAKNVKVRVTDAAGHDVGGAETDAEGNFTYTGARPAGGVIFVASTADGHRAESKLEGEQGAGPATETAPATSSERQLGAIQEAIDRLEKRLWLRDVIGGIGYIFGLAGFWALWKSRRGRVGH